MRKSDHKGGQRLFLGARLFLFDFFHVTAIGLEALIGSGNVSNSGNLGKCQRIRLSIPWRLALPL